MHISSTAVPKDVVEKKEKIAEIHHYKHRHKENTNAHLINKTCIRDGEKKKEKKNKGEGSEKISTQHIFHFVNCSAAHTR